MATSEFLCVRKSPTKDALSVGLAGERPRLPVATVSTTTAIAMAASTTQGADSSPTLTYPVLRRYRGTCGPLFSVWRAPRGSGGRTEDPETRSSTRGTTEVLGLISSTQNVAYASPASAEIVQSFSQPYAHACKHAGRKDISGVLNPPSSNHTAWISRVTIRKITC